MDVVELLNYTIAFFTIFVTVFFLLLFLKYRKEYYKRERKKLVKAPFVSVVVPAHNEEKCIERCIESLLSLDYPSNRLEIIVVDDGSRDRTYEIAKKYEKMGVRVFRRKRCGKGAALNYGISKARGQLVATMDADSFVTPEVLVTLIPYFRDKKVAAVTPAIKIAPGGSLLKEFQRVEYLMILFSRKLLSFIDAVPVTPGPFSLFRKSVLEEVGYFDENNLVEDQEIALRIQAHNYKIKSSVDDESTVYTAPPENIRDLLRQRVRWQRGGIRNYWKYKFLINKEFGDFGVFFIPLNFATLGAFFIILGLLINAFFNNPYYTRYIIIESIMLSVNMFTILGAFVFIASALWLYIAVKSFKVEKVKLRHILFFMFFYWYLMLGYNVLMVLSELKRERCKW